LTGNNSPDIHSFLTDNSETIKHRFPSSTAFDRFIFQGAVTRNFAVSMPALSKAFEQRCVFLNPLP
jgi:hypothetical protein